VARVVAQLRDPLVLVLLAAAVLTTATGDWTDTTVIMLVVVVNTTTGVVLEVNADHAISALTQLTAPEAGVIPRRRSAPASGRGHVRRGDERTGAEFRGHGGLLVGSCLAGDRSLDRGPSGAGLVTECGGGGSDGGEEVAWFDCAGQPVAFDLSPDRVLELGEDQADALGA
jgi:hypothetical protein